MRHGNGIIKDWGWSMKPDLLRIKENGRTHYIKDISHENESSKYRWIWFEFKNNKSKNMWQITLPSLPSVLHPTLCYFPFFYNGAINQHTKASSYWYMFSYTRLIYLHTCTFKFRLLDGQTRYMVNKLWICKEWYKWLNIQSTFFWISMEIQVISMLQTIQ